MSLESRISLGKFGGGILFKLFKSVLNKREQRIFDITVRPYIIYSAINIIFMWLSSKNVGRLNDDVFGGLFISWIIYSFVMLFSIGFKE